MPAYFSVTFELNKSKTAVRDFCTALIDAGFIFKSGFWGFEKDSFEDIIVWNQTKLDENFQLGCAEHHSHDFKQMLFDFADFSEVRLYITNDKKTSTFNFHLIIPEKDLVELPRQKEQSPYHKTEKMELLKILAKHMWKNTEILAIQTEWEYSDSTPKAKNISKKIKPQAEPFCIIKNSPIVKKLSLLFEKVERNGVLIEEINNRNYK